MFVIVLKSNLLDHTRDCLSNLLGDGNFDICYVNNDDQKSLYWHMTAASLLLQEHLIKNASIAIDMIKTPVLVIFDQINDFAVIKNQLNTDEVFFDTLHCNKSPSLMYGSIVAVSKILRSSIKFENFLKDNAGKISKIPFNSPTSDLFQLIWYTQRTGLKIYEHVN